MTKPKLTPAQRKALERWADGQWHCPDIKVHISIDFPLKQWGLIEENPAKRSDRGGGPTAQPHAMRG